MENLAPFENCKAHKQWIFISNDEKTLRPCCHFKTNIEAENLADYRHQLSKLDIKTNCDTCITQEKHGNKYTLRQELEDTLKDRQLKITVAFDNLCNLKCVYCYPRYSTQIASEFKEGPETKFYKLLSEQTPTKIKFLKTMLLEEDFDSIQFEILGGEPLINPLIFEFLDWMATQNFANNVSLSISTNGTVFTEKLFHYSNIFKWVSLNFSIDGTDEVFDYIRFNASYTKVKNNIDQYYQRQTPKFLVSFNYALTWMNCLNFAEWFNWMCRDYPDVNWIHMNKVLSPDWCSVDIISLEDKKTILKKVSDTIITTTTTNPTLINSYETYKTLVATGDDNSHLYPMAKAELEIKDSKRGSNYADTFFEVLNIMSNTK